MSKNYYDILEIQKNSDDNEIKKAYRKLALKWHPDKNPDNREEAELRFKEISEAYSVLSDSEKKSNYDRFGDANGGGGFENVFRGNGFQHSRQHQQHQPFNSPDDIFKMFFGGGSPFGSQFDDMSGMNQFQQESMQRMRKCEPKIVVIPISLLDIYNGSHKKVTIPVKKICITCSGKGGINIKMCDGCKGTGISVITRMIGPGMIQKIQNTCKMCGGNKTVSSTPCKKCDTRGIIAEEKTFVLTVVKGAQNDDKIVYENEGNEMVNELKGDIIFVIKEDNKTNFVKKGNNLIYEYEIFLGNSICGVLVEFDHLNGEKIIYKEDNIIPHNSFRVIKNKGMPIKGKDGEFGDLYVVYVIKNYDVKLTKAQKEIFAEVLPCKKIDNKAADNVSANEKNFQHNFSLSGI